MFKKSLKFFLAILSVVLIGLIVWVVINREHYDFVYRSHFVQTSTTMEHDIVLSQIEPITKGEADWICWRGVNGDGRSGVSGIKTDWSDGLSKIWEIDFLCQGEESATWSAPVIQGNRLVVCGRDDVNDIVFCLNPEDGGLIWKQAYPAQTSSASYGAGFRATPWIDDDRVYTFGRVKKLFQPDTSSDWEPRAKHLDPKILMRAPRLHQHHLLWWPSSKG